MNVTVIGGGLAGCEAAWQLACRGIGVTIIEMKPRKKSPAHTNDNFAELVCSNSLRSDQIENACGLLKEELRLYGSLIMTCADSTRVEAGGALAVDREGFSAMVTEKIKSHPNITVISKECNEIPSGDVIIATGPLTSEPMAEAISNKLGGDGYLHFYDASAPIVTLDSIDMDKAFFASRYNKGTADYINCPMDKEQYEAFWAELIRAEEAPVHGFEDKNVFEGCMPVEVMARRGIDTLTFGPLKPKGLPDPRTGKEYHAVVQLRRDNKDGTIYNLVGFQTHLKHPEQKRVFSMIPGLENAEFVRYGVMHRNTFIKSPGVLGSGYELLSDPRIYFAGQMTGVEGYIESTASGFTAGVTMARKLLGLSTLDFPCETAVGALAHYISDVSVKDFQPMNVNYGIMSPLTIKFRGKKDKHTKLAERAMEIANSLVDTVFEGIIETR